MKHIKGEVNRKTESINSSIFEGDPYIQNVKTRIRVYKEKSMRNPIVNNEKRKSEMLNRIIKIREEERRIINSCIEEDI